MEYAESNGELQHLFIPNKTSTLIPEFAVEDLPLGRNAALVTVCSERRAIGQNTLMIMTLSGGEDLMALTLPV